MIDARPSCLCFLPTIPCRPEANQRRERFGVWMRQGTTKTTFLRRANPQTNTHHSPFMFSERSSNSGGSLSNHNRDNVMFGIIRRILRGSGSSSGFEGFTGDSPFRTFLFDNDVEAAVWRKAVRGKKGKYHVSFSLVRKNKYGEKRYVKSFSSEELLILANAAYRMHRWFKRHERNLP